MQRQLSLSPVPKQQHKDGSGSDAAEAMVVPEESAAAKADNRSAKEERSIHLIPLITFLCFLLLFLCSHDPSPSDMLSFGSGGGVGKAGNRRLRML